MAKSDRAYTYGDHWLTKRRDGASPDIWQIATGTRQVRYRSTRKRDLEEAKGVIHAYVEEERAKGKQSPDVAKVVPLLFTYWKEHGKKADSAGQIASSLRQFIGFLMQDEATLNLTVAGIESGLWDRFRDWRMAPHSYSVPWGSKDYEHSSPGVSGEAVQRNLDDIRAALNHAANRNRVPLVPKVPSVPKEHRSEARDLVLSTEQIGAIIGYAAYSLPALRWVLAMIATAGRPEALLALDPKRQYKPEFGLLDTHPPERRRTKKHNPVLPVVWEFAPWLEAWAANPHRPVQSRKVWWRHMRAQLELPPLAVPKTIRHTIATRLRGMGVPADQIEMQLGHLILKKTTRVYAKYDPEYLASARSALSKLFREYCAAAHEWLAVHSLSTPKRDRPLQVVKNGSNLPKMAVGADGLEPPTLSV